MSKDSVFEKIGITVAALPIVAVVIVVIALPLMLLRAFVFRYLWAWFIVPLFALEPLTYGQAMGVALIVAFFSSPSPIKKEYKESDLSQLGLNLFSLAMLLGVGYLIHRFWM